MKSVVGSDTTKEQIDAELAKPLPGGRHIGSRVSEAEVKDEMALFKSAMGH